MEDINELLLSTCPQVDIPECPEPLPPTDPLSIKFKQWASLPNSFNSQLYKNKSFKNPCIHSRLVNYLGLDERGTNEWRVEFPPELYYDELVKLHSKRMEQRKIEIEKERKDPDTVSQINFVSARK